jgi:single-strand DNA-binding protein
MQTRSWDGQDGQKRYKTELVAETVKFLGSRSDLRDGGNFTPGLAVGADTEGDLDPDDLPF